MASLKEKLETIDTYYNTVDIFPDAGQRKLKDYKNVLETYRNYKIVNDACEGKTTLTEEVEQILGLVTEKYKGFLNFWKPYRNTDIDYNREIENLEKILGETDRIKTGGNKAKTIAKYAGLEILSDITGLLTSAATLGSIFLLADCIPSLYSLSNTAQNVIGIGMIGFSLGIGGLYKWMLMPQVMYKNLRKSEVKRIRKDAKFVQSTIEKVYSCKEYQEKNSLGG